MTAELVDGPAPAAELPVAVRRGFRQVAVAAVLLTLMSAGLFSWMVFAGQPQVTGYRKALVASLHAHQAMLDQETALRGFLSTGDRGFLGPYVRGRADVGSADRALRRHSDGRTLTGLVSAFVAAQQRWENGWAQVAAAPASRSVRSSPAAFSAFLNEDKTLFDDYRRHYDTLDAAISTTMDRYRNRENTIMAATGVAEVAVAIGVLGLAWLRRRQVGDYALRREQAALAQSERLRQVLTLAREVAGSLNLRYVLDAVATTTRAVGGFDRAEVWLLDDDTGLLTAAREPDRAGAVAVERGAGLVGRCAVEARVLTSATGDAPAIAVPMIVGARVVGVVEGQGRGDDLDADSLEVLEMLSVHAASAIEAARLHSRTTELSLMDALTGLANRRRLDDDLALEVERALRYGRPLSLVMLDLDHFKRLNDTHGHQRGDLALQQAAQTVRANLRSTDSAYRYGGEEIAVLVRDSVVPGAAELGERLRADIERGFNGPHGLGVTASIGVAGIPDHAATAAGLVEAADKALYASKRAGRNRVSIAGSEQAADRSAER